MLSCLGIYVQNNLIKYSKVSKEHNNIKVEAYGVKFFETDIEKVIERIIEETFSYQIPISVNIDREKYTYANVFNLLKPTDVEKAIDTEFEFFCNNNNKNINTLEYRKIKADNLEDRDKVRVIYSYIDKANLVERIQLFDSYKLNTLTPVSMIIPNLNRTGVQENSLIVNIEENTELTTMVNGKVYKVDKIDLGMKDILNPIIEKENSVQRAYEICKNTTVYTKSGQNLKIDGNEYLDEIVNTLFEIIQKVKDTMGTNDVKIDNIYISGMGLIINNIDLLFQENFIDKRCEIFIPSFIEKTSVKMNIKDYIEVNSALALALHGLDPKNQELNFSDKGKKIQRVWDVLNSDLGKDKGKSKNAKKGAPKPSFKDVMSADLDLTEKLLLRGVAASLLIISLYTASSELLTKQLKIKKEDVDKVIASNEKEISEIVNYSTMIKTRESEYQKLIDEINEASANITESYSSKNAVPNLLNQIMYNIPKGVQLISIENPSGKDITIVAKSEKYDQLGYFKAVLEEEGILVNVTTTKGVKQNELIDITITGQLPF